MGAGNAETIYYALELVRSHDMAVLTETRESKERLIFLKNKLPKDVQLFSSRNNQYSGGVAIIVRNDFLQHFGGRCKWSVFVKGRLARLEFSGAKGCLHVYAVYLNPDDPRERDEQIRRLADVMDPAVHNLVAGDFNFVTCDGDRISKLEGACHSNAADKRNAITWNDIANGLHLKEFEHDGFTCENSSGWSRIDRLYTNLHTADVCSMRCACNLLEHPRHLSDHRPVSMRISGGEKHNRAKTIPRWVTEHEKYKAELLDEFIARCGDFERLRKRPPTAFENLEILKKSAHKTASYIRRLCDSQVADTTAHKLAVGMSFLRAVRSSNLERAKQLQNKCVELHQFKITEDFVHTQDFIGVMDSIVAWMKSDIQVRADELKRLRASLPETIYEQRKKGVLASLKSMAPGGCGDIAAMMDEDGKIATDASEIAKVLNSHWQKVFSHQATDRELRMSWLEIVKDKFRTSKEKLRPTRDIVRRVIQDSGSAAPGPDAVPFEVYRAMGEAAVELFWEAANAMLDGSVTPGDDFNLAKMVCLPKAADGLLEDSTPFYTPSGTRPLSIVDASNRILASIFCEVLEKEIGPRIERAQKGFLKKRQLLRNVLDIDFAAHKVSIRSRSGAIILFDFKAAFPSLSHDMLWDTLAATGIDADFIRVVKMFYHENKHLLKVRGETFKGVSVE